MIKFAKKPFAFILDDISGVILKQTMNLGAYGWRHKHWSNTFYPEDLPVDADDDWRLAYYSNEFNAVLVPADYWQAGQVNNCEDWLDSVHPEFQFFVECHHSMFDAVSLTDLTGALEQLLPQLSGLVFLDQGMPAGMLASEAVKQQFIRLSDSLELEVFSDTYDSNIARLWRPGDESASSSEKLASSRLAYIEDDLLDLRSVKLHVEQYASYLDAFEVDDGTDAAIIIKHPQLQAGNLSKFRSVLDIMGF